MVKKLGMLVAIICLTFLVSVNALADTITLDANLVEEVQFSNGLTDSSLNGNDSFFSGWTFAASEQDELGPDLGPGAGPGPGREPHPRRGPGWGADGEFLMMTMALLFVIVILQSP